MLEVVVSTEVEAKIETYIGVIGSRVSRDNEIWKEKSQMVHLDGPNDDYHAWILKAAGVKWRRQRLM